MFQQVRETLAAEGSRIQLMAGLVSELDALLGFAELAHQNDYCRPVLDESDLLQLKNGRHPLVELIDPSNPFIPNDTALDCDGNQIADYRRSDPCDLPVTPATDPDGEEVHVTVNLAGRDHGWQANNLDPR